MRELSRRKVGVVNWDEEELKEELKIAEELTRELEMQSLTHPLNALKHAEVIDKLDLLLRRVIV